MESRISATVAEGMGMEFKIHYTYRKNDTLNQRALEV
jgi:hypothetical protein